MKFRPVAIITGICAALVSDAHATLDASTATQYEIDADGGERVDSAGAVINEDGQRAGWYWSSADGVAPPKWEKSSLRVYRGTYAWRSVMNNTNQYRNEQKPIASWDKADGARFFRFAFCAGPDMATPSGWTCLVQWWQLGTSPPVGIWMYDDRKPRLRTKDDFGSADAENPRITSRWMDDEPCADGAWHNYLVKIKWGVTDGELQLWKWENDQWVSKYSVTNTYIGYHDEGMEQGVYTWKMGGYRETGQGTWDVFYDELKYASIWEEVIADPATTNPPAMPVIYWTGHEDRWGGGSLTLTSDDNFSLTPGGTNWQKVSSGESYHHVYDRSAGTMAGTNAFVLMNRASNTVGSLTLVADALGNGFQVELSQTSNNVAGMRLGGPVTVQSGLHIVRRQTEGSNTSTIALTNDSMWDISPGAQLRWAIPLTGSFGMTKSGDGTLLLSGAQFYTGNTYVSEGVIGADSASASLASNLVFDAGAKLRFQPASTLAVAGTTSFDGGFGVADLDGLDASVALGSYQLISGSVNFGNITNLGPTQAVLLDTGKRAFFENSGGLRLRVVADFPNWPQPTLQWVGFDQGRAVLALQGVAPAGYTLQSSTNDMSWQDAGSMVMSASPALWTNSTSANAIPELFRARLDP